MNIAERSMFWNVLKEDLERKILRTPLPADQTMMDDPLRFLRASFLT
jgi:hypothetical protein